MSRKWTARKSTTLVEAAIEAGNFSAAYPIHRADPVDPLAAHKEAARFFAAYTLLWLPLHVGIYHLAAYSLPAAVWSVLVVVTGLSATALARWLRMDDALRLVPVLALAALIVLGAVVFMTTLSSPATAWGFEQMGYVWILVIASSVLSGLFRPMSAAYQTLTFKTQVRELGSTVAAMLASLGLVVLSRFLPGYAYSLFALAALGGFAGLVVFEYAAWARANPNHSLEYAGAFPLCKRRGPLVLTPRLGFKVCVASALLGLSLAALVTLLPTPSPELTRHLLALAENDPKKAREGFGSLLLLGLIGLVFAFIGINSALGTLRLPGPAVVQLSWKAIVVFLTYPETSHPLVHRICIPWLRPPVVRNALTGVVLAAVLTGVLHPGAKQEVAPHRREQSAPPQAAPGFGGQQGVDDWARLLRQGGGNDHLQHPPATGKPPDAKSDLACVEFAAKVLLVIAGPLLLLYEMVLLAGACALPAYFNYFEKAQQPPSRN